MQFQPVFQPVGSNCAQCVGVGPGGSGEKRNDKPSPYCCLNQHGVLLCAMNAPRPNCPGAAMLSADKTRFTRKIFFDSMQRQMGIKRRRDGSYVEGRKACQ